MPWQSSPNAQRRPGRSRNLEACFIVTDYTGQKMGIRPRQCVTIVKSSGLRNSAVTPGSLVELAEIDGVGS
jgi:hypothetical protein